MYYATLEQVRQEFDLTADETHDDQRILEYIQRAQEGIDNVSGRFYDIRKGLYKFDYPLMARSLSGIYDIRNWVYRMNAVTGLQEGELVLDQDLLEAYHIYNGDDSEILLDDVVFGPANFYPKKVIRLNNFSVHWIRGPQQGKQAIKVDGLFCYHKRPDQMWVDSGDTLSDDIAMDDTEITVTDPTDKDMNGIAPRFQVGQRLKLEDPGDPTYYEFLDIIDIDNGVLMVKRGQAGTDASAWLSGTTIWRFAPWRNIVTAATTYTKYLFRLRDTDAFNKDGSPGGGTVPSTIPSDVLRLLPPRPPRFK